MDFRLAITAAVALACSGFAEAQTAPTPEPSSTLTPAQQANRDRIKGKRETCQTQAQGQGLKGEAVGAAALECMFKVVPVITKRMGVRPGRRGQEPDRRRPRKLGARVHDRGWPRLFCARCGRMFRARSSRYR